LKVCPRLCEECPFSLSSSRGFLATYTLSDFIEFFSREVLFACHTFMKRSMSLQQMEQDVRDEKLLLCKGYVDCMKKSCKLPRDPEFALALKNTRSSKHSMDIRTFQLHHNQRTTRKPK
jgi:hypothetical protein